MALDFFKNLIGGRPHKTKKPEQSRPIFFHNTLTSKKEQFEALRFPEVRMYNCGPTVYDYAHIGNLFSYMFADTLKRTLAYNGYEVEQVINITDVGHLVSDNDEGEDKIEKGAKREGKSAKEITETYTRSFFEDLELLNIDVHSITFPRATEHIGEQIAFIESLEQKGYTYKTSDGIYFDTSKFPKYGKLGNINLKGLVEGARVSVNAEKKNATDFALWKLSKPEDKRQQEWDSPWGVGFPGWHIECSAMSIKYLGKSFDIHTGGVDHISVHHNNEIAQSESVTGKPFVRYWMHHAHILIDSKKIAKSEGNSVYLKNIIAKGMSPLSYRYLLLTSHYRTQSNFTWEALEASQTALFKLQKHFVENLGSKNGLVNEKYKEQFLGFINDDLNTAQALALVWTFIKDESVKKEDKRATLLDFDRVLGLRLSELDSTLETMQTKYIDVASLPTHARKLVEEREAARKAKNFIVADELRQKISDLGYNLEDKPEGIKIRLHK